MNRLRKNALLDLLKCLPDTPVANIQADEVEQFTQQARKLWEQQQGITSPNPIGRICACLLVPNNKKEDFENIL